MLAAGCGGKDEQTPTTPTSPTPPPETQVQESGGKLAIGITEPNPAFVWPDREVPAEFDRWRDALQKMRPAYYRLVVDWTSVEADLGAHRAGCMRDIPPCAGYNGLREQLEAIAAAQKKGGWEVMVVFTGTPDRYAQKPSGCERAGLTPRSRPPTAEGLEAFRDLIGRVKEAARGAGAKLRYWSPWNEPNHPFGLSPQRRRCSAKSKTTAVAPYVELANVVREELDEGQTLVLGELAGLTKRKAGYTPISEFIRELPSDLVCASPIFGQHGYVGGPDPVEHAVRALERHGCERAHEIWMTETGAGAPRRGEYRRTSGAAQRRACRNIRKRLLQWHEDPRVDVAFQYTLREDDRFPTGLVTTDLSEAYPALAEWTAWGGERRPEDEPPASTCSG